MHSSPISTGSLCSASVYCSIIICLLLVCVPPSCAGGNCEVEPPTARCISSIHLQAPWNGFGKILPEEVEDGSVDACGRNHTLHFSMSESQYTCFERGTRKTLLVVWSDSAGPQAKGYCEVIVTVECIYPGTCDGNYNGPQAVCNSEAITIAVGPDEDTVLEPSQIDAGSDDGCGGLIGGVSRRAIPNAYQCDDVTRPGVNGRSVTLMVTDWFNDNRFCQAQVIIVPKNQPEAHCQDITVHVPLRETVNITMEDIDANSTDEYGLTGGISRFITPGPVVSYRCVDAGVKTLRLSVGGGNPGELTCATPSTCTAKVTVVCILPDGCDWTSSPIASCKLGTRVPVKHWEHWKWWTNVGPEDIDTGSVDACEGDAGGISMEIEPKRYSCDDLGTSTLTMTVTSYFGFEAECTTEVEVYAEECPTGSFCPTKDACSALMCPKGTFGDPELGLLTNVSHCTTCPTGFYCSPAGQTEPTGKCLKGFYCPSGTGDFHTYPCPRGSLTRLTGSVFEQECVICNPGEYCNVFHGVREPTACPVGMYCEDFGSWMPKCCPQGTYCPGGAITPTQCPNGTYSYWGDGGCDDTPKERQCPDLFMDMCEINKEYNTTGCCPTFVWECLEEKGIDFNNLPTNSSELCSAWVDIMSCVAKHNCSDNDMTFGPWSGLCWDVKTYHDCGVQLKCYKTDWSGHVCSDRPRWWMSAATECTVSNTYCIRTGGAVADNVCRCMQGYYRCLTTRIPCWPTENSVVCNDQSAHLQDCPDACYLPDYYRFSSDFIKILVNFQAVEQYNFTSVVADLLDIDDTQVSISTFIPLFKKHQVDVMSKLNIQLYTNDTDCTYYNCTLLDDIQTTHFLTFQLVDVQVHEAPILLKQITNLITDGHEALVAIGVPKQVPTIIPQYPEPEKGCLPGETECDGFCVDTTTDWQHCSECGNACASKTCVSSQCGVNIALRLLFEVSPIPDDLGSDVWSDLTELLQVRAANIEVHLTTTRLRDHLPVLDPPIDANNAVKVAQAIHDNTGSDPIYTCVITTYVYGQSQASLNSIMTLLSETGKGGQQIISVPRLAEAWNAKPDQFKNLFGALRDRGLRLIEFVDELENGFLRTRSGKHVYSGRVQYYQDGEWFGVCEGDSIVNNNSTSWPDDNSNAVCKDIGFLDGGVSIDEDNIELYREFEIIKPSLRKNFQCSPTSNSLHDCTITEWTAQEKCERNAYLTCNGIWHSSNLYPPSAEGASIKVGAGDEGFSGLETDSASFGVGVTGTGDPQVRAVTDDNAAVKSWMCGTTVVVSVLLSSFLLLL